MEEALQAIVEQYCSRDDHALALRSVMSVLAPFAEDERRRSDAMQRQLDDGLCQDLARCIFDHLFAPTVLRSRSSLCAVGRTGSCEFNTEPPESGIAYDYDQLPSERFELTVSFRLPGFWRWS